MPQKKQDLLSAVLNYVPAAVAFLIPIFFLPTTSEFFEYNKLALVTLATLLLAIAWGAKMLLEKKVEITKSTMDLPLLLITAVFVLSTIFSIDKNSSIFGSQGKWFPSLIGWLVFLAFYYIVSTNVNKDQTLKYTVMALIGGISVSSLVAVLSYFGIYIGSATYLRIPNFTMSGSVLTTAVMAAIAMVMSVFLIIESEKVPEKLLLTQTAILNFIAVALIGRFPSWVVLTAGLVSLLALVDTQKIKQNKPFLAGVSIVVIVTIAVLITPGTKDLIINKDYPRDIKLPVKESWLVTSSIVRDFPILGAGPSTFYLNYPRYRPLSMNGDALWNVRFDRPYNEIFGVMGAFGIIGAMVFLFFIVRLVKATILMRHEKEDSSLSRLLSVGMVMVLVSFLFSNATIALTFLLFLFMALSTAQSAYSENRKYAENVLLSLASFSAMSIAVSDNESKKEALQYIASTLIFAAVAAGGYFTGKSYVAEYYMRQSLKAIQSNNGAAAYDFQRKAIQTNPKRDAYHNTYAQTNLALANSLAARENLNDEDRQTIQTLIAQSIRSAKVATEVVNPLNVLNWETRAAIYRALLGIADNADQWSITAYNAAIQLDPTNPRLRLDLGGIYYAQGDYLSAANLFRQATTLKTDYANAHYNFAAALIHLDDAANARRELEIVKGLVAEGSADYQRVIADLEGIENMPEVAGAQTEKPTVEEIESVLPEENAGAPAPQEPLTNVGEEEVLEPGVDLNVNAQGNVVETGTEPTTEVNVEE